MGGAVRAVECLSHPDLWGGRGWASAWTGCRGLGCVRRMATRAGCCVGTAGGAGPCTGRRQPPMVPSCAALPRAAPRAAMSIGPTAGRAPRVPAGMESSLTISGSQPNAVTYSAAIIACARLADWQRAVELKDQMLARWGGVRQYRAWLDGGGGGGGGACACMRLRVCHCRWWQGAGSGERAPTPRRAASARSCVPRAASPPRPTTSARRAATTAAAAACPGCRGLPASPIVYNSVLAACEASRQLDAALDLLDEMRVAGVPRDQYTYSTLMSCCYHVSPPAGRWWFGGGM